MTRPLKIFWGINPFQDDGLTLRRGEGLVRLLTKGKARVRPVYVAGSDEFYISHKTGVRSRKSHRSPEEEKLRKHLAGVRGAQSLLLPPKVLVAASPGLTASAKKLATYLREENADALILATHARSGLARLVLGSYAESLLAFSKAPILLLNPRAKTPRRINRILFASDFSGASSTTFPSLCRFAAATGASIDLLNILECPTRWPTNRGYLIIGAEVLTPQEYVASLNKRRVAQGAGLLTIARRAKVPASVQVEASSGRVADAILDTARKMGADMIAMASQSSRLRAGLLGSVAREVLHGAFIPVWLMRSA